MSGCIRPDGFADNAGDCDDTTSAVNPGVGEVCDAGDVDENCDGDVNPASLCACTGAETRPCSLGGLCASGVETCETGTFGECSIAPVTETCNGQNDDCDANVDEGLTVRCYPDADNDGFAANGAAEANRCPDSSRVDVGGCPAFTTNLPPFMSDIDCDDDVAALRPNATEVCNGTDDDCDGGVDEGFSISCWSDGDGDTYALLSAERQQTCAVPGREFVGGCPSGFTNRDPATASDCDDGRSAVNPAGTETCNGRNDDCDGDTDEGVTTTYTRDADGTASAPTHLVRPRRKHACGRTAS